MCKRQAFLCLLFVAGLLRLAHGQPAAAQAVEPSGDEKAVRAASEQYMAALAKGDFKTLGDLWTADGDFVDEHGRSVPARQVLEREAAAKQEGPRLEFKFTGSSIRFVTPDVAIEDGQAELVQSEKQSLPPVRGKFTAIWVKKNGAWKLASLREARVENPASNELEQLDALTGRWTGKQGGLEVEISAHWNMNRTYLERELLVRREGHVVFSGNQHIGWDPLSGQIRSWMFDSDGGRGEGYWSRHGESWIVQTTGVLPDGKQTAATNVYTPKDPDHWQWKTTGARRDGEAGPEVDVELTRQSSN